MPTHYKGTRREVRALDTFIKLQRASESFTDTLQRALAPHGLTLGQFGVLEALHHLGEMSQRELAGKLLRSNSNITTVLDNLEQAGHVQRARCAEDRRRVTVSLTAAGRQLIGRVFPGHAAQITELLGCLSAAEQEQLGALCKKLGLSIRG